jgi:peptidoglycan/xylan/chitin deacetylase (PgdA/CDA1 family)
MVDGAGLPPRVVEAPVIELHSMIEKLPLFAWPPGGQMLTCLIYHRVLPAPDPLRTGEVVLADFERHMSFVGRNFDVLPLADAVRALFEGKLRRRTCCVTFDDGYADNYTVALPVMRRHSIPATVFVATDYLDGGRMFNDSVIECVARATNETINLERFGVEELPIRSIGEKQAAVVRLQVQAKYLGPSERDEFVESVRLATGSGELPDDLMLTSEQMRSLSASDVEIGGHTASHTVLTTLDSADARMQIKAGRERIESILGKSVRLFAYPNGKPGRDYGLEHVRAVADLGFEAAVSTAPGVAVPTTDRFQLPRYTPWRNSPVEFSAQMVRNAWNRGPTATV